MPGNAETRIECKRPSDCSPEEIESFYRLILKAGEVNPEWLKYRIGKARCLAFCYQGDILIGVCALKQPRSPYREEVFQRAGISSQAADFNIEIGWGFTEPQYRGKGVCSALLERLITEAAGEGIFAVARANNFTIANILKKHGFREVGGTYKGKISSFDLQVFILQKRRQ